jgi:hypothetical protein
MNLTKFFAITFFTFILALSAFAADRALVIGIEHYLDERKCNSAMDNLKQGCVTPTFGGIADAKALERLAEERFGFNRSEIRTLKESQATANNIRDSFKEWLIKGTNPGDRVFFFYSGHGARIKDDGDDEDDKMDEILAPFDIQTRPSIANFIRDDEINEWIAALAGRQVVMVFDSCHSGTISRSINTKREKFSKYLITEDVPISRGGITDTFSDVPKQIQTRDLSTVTDKYMGGKIPNVVVISATEAYQQAMWFDANGSTCGTNPRDANYRGALAYLFEKVYQTGNPTLTELKSQLKKGMSALGENGTNQLCPAETGYQIPELEFNKTLANKTLWGMTNAATLQPNWEDSALTALQNPLGKLGVKIQTNNSATNFKIGETIPYSVTLNQSSYVYVVVFSRQDVATVIFPFIDPENSKQTNNFLMQGVQQLPDGISTCPVGKDVWVVIASNKRISSLENLPFGTQYSWQAVLDKIGAKDLATNLSTIAQTRGVLPASTKLNAEDWQTSTFTTYTLPGNTSCPKE